MNIHIYGSKSFLIKHDLVLVKTLIGIIKGCKIIKWLWQEIRMKIYDIVKKTYNKYDRFCIWYKPKRMRLNLHKISNIKGLQDICFKKWDKKR